MITEEEEIFEQKEERENAKRVRNGGYLTEKKKKAIKYTHFFGNYVGEKIECSIRIDQT